MMVRVARGGSGVGAAASDGALGLGSRGLVAVECVVEGAWALSRAWRIVYLVVMRVWGVVSWGWVGERGREGKGREGRTVLGCALRSREDWVSHSWAVGRCGMVCVCLSVAVVIGLRVCVVVGERRKLRGGGEAGWICARCTGKLSWGGGICLNLCLAAFYLHD